MCLFISSDPKKNREDLENFINGQEEIIVYKILYKHPENDFYQSNIYYEFKWDFSKQKVFQIDRPSKPTKEELKDLDINHGAIDEGFHVYLLLEKARTIYQNTGTSHRKIVKFRVNKEDIVAIENNICFKDLNFTRAVCTKLEFIEVLEY